MTNKHHPKYINNNGTELDPDLISLPGLCVTCKKESDPSQEILCNLNRADQHGEDEFYCGEYESISET